MIIRKTYKENYKLYFKKEAENLTDLMHKYMANEIHGQRLSSGNECRSVEIIEYHSRKFIIKNDREVDSRFEKKIQNFLFGPFSSRLIKMLDNLPPEIRACTADLYVVAEKTRYRQCYDVYTLHEYIEGTPLHEINKSNENDLKALIQRLHQAGLASNDIHAGNFIRTPGGELRIIDLSCKGSLKICQANDILTLQNKYHFDIAGKGIIYQLIRLKEKFRRLSRRMRGK